MTSNKKKALAAGGVGIVLAGWLGASIHAGSVAERELRAFAARPSSETGVRVRNLQHSGGLFASKGSFGLEIVDQCGDGPPAALELEYSLAHLILPTSPIRVEWSARPSGEIAAALAEVFGPSLKLEGKGDVSFGGEFRSAMALPELAMDADGGKLTIAPSSGRLAFGKTALAVSWGIERVLARGNGEAFELGRVALDLDLKNRYLGTGTTSLSIDKIATSHGSAEGFRHATEVVEEGDRLHTRVTENLRAAAFGGETVKDLSLELAIRDVDKQSVETLSRLAGDTCGFQNMTVDEDQSFRKALRTLLVQGFSVGVPKLAGTIGNGSLEGRLTLEARKAASPKGPIALASMFRSTGELIVRGQALAADKKQQALALGFTQEKDGSLKGRFEYVDGILRTNGRVFDGSMVLAGLTNADQAINAFLDGSRLARHAPAPVPQPPQALLEEDEAPEEAVAQVAVAVPPVTPAPAAPAAPAAAAPAPAASAPACDSTRQCLGQALGAAAREDAGSVFAVAARIDELGKPALGNRAIARKLNTEGLEALKADDPARAAELFRKGLAENPRDVEIAGNLGFALVKAGKAEEAVGVLTAALALDPRRSSTWTPLAEALALAGRKDESQAALWVAYQWSGNREKSLAFYSDRAEKEKAVRPAISELYASVLGWVTDGRRPRLASLMAG